MTTARSTSHLVLCSLLFLLIRLTVTQACQACLVGVVGGSSSSAAKTSARMQIFLRKRIAALATHRVLTHPVGGVVKPIFLVTGAYAARKYLSTWDSRSLLRSTENEEGLVDDEAGDPDDAESRTNSDESLDPSSSAMVGAIGFYKEFISPMLPPACRFLPTCSQYGVQAIQQFGPCKGFLLTTWRIMRCTPIGGKGYDPPRWPPVPYNYGRY